MVFLYGPPWTTETPRTLALHRRLWVLCRRTTESRCSSALRPKAEAQAAAHDAQLDGVPFLPF